MIEVVHDDGILNIFLAESHIVFQVLHRDWVPQSLLISGGLPGALIESVLIHMTADQFAAIIAATQKSANWQLSIRPLGPSVQEGDPDPAQPGQNGAGGQGEATEPTRREEPAASGGDTAIGRMDSAEGYPPGWQHCVIHLNPVTGEMHSDGDHRVRHWLQERLKEDRH
jgi:hypothetical protein